MTQDLTRGSPAKLLISFATPFLIGNIFQQFYNVADTVIVGRTLGTNALAAVGATGSLSWFAIGGIGGLTSGFSALTARYFGADDREGIRKSFSMSILLSVLITGILTALCLLFIHPILELMNTPAEIFEDAQQYISWIFIGLFATTLFNLLSNMIRALGDSITPLIFLVIACVINIILDYTFILIFHMGPEGTGLATVISQLISGILCIGYVIKKMPLLHFKKREMIPDFKMMKELLRIGLPMGFLNMILSIGVIILQFVNNGLGTLYVAAHTAATKIQQFVELPFSSFGSALSVYTSQNYGAGSLKRIKKGTNRCLLILFVWWLFSFLLIALFGQTLLSWIAGSENTDLLSLGYQYILYNSGLSIFLFPVIIYKCVLQSVGRAFIPILSGFEEVICRTFAAVFLTEHFGFLGICLTHPTAWIGVLWLVALDYFLLLRKFRKTEQKQNNEKIA